MTAIRCYKCGRRKCSSAERCGKLSAGWFCPECEAGWREAERISRCGRVPGAEHDLCCACMVSGSCVILGTVQIILCPQCEKASK